MTELRPKRKAATKGGAKPRRASARKRATARAADHSQPGKGGDKRAWSHARSEQHRLKREAVLRIASRLINRKGYAGMSLTDIADELAIRNASLYYYFESKEDLVFACFERAQRIVGEAISSVAKSRGTGLQEIERYVVTIRDRIRTEGELPVASNVWSLDHAHMKIIIAAEIEHVRHVTSLIESKRFTRSSVPTQTRTPSCKATRGACLNSNDCSNRKNLATHSVTLSLHEYGSPSLILISRPSTSPDKLRCRIANRKSSFNLDF